MTHPDPNPAAGDAAPRRSPLPRNLAMLALLLGAIALFHWIKTDPRVFRVASPDNVNLIVLLAALGIGVSARHTPAAFRLLQAYITVSMTIYLVTGYALHERQVGHPVADWTWVAVACAVASFWRPSMALIPVMAVMWTKILTKQDFGLSVSSTDYMVVLELGAIMALTLIPASFIQLGARLRPRWAEAAACFNRDYLNAAVVIAAAVHLSNYFYSGHEKLVLQNAQWHTWMLENPTYLLTAIVRDFGYLTVFELPQVPDALMPLIEWITVPLNMLVLGAQLAVGVALFSRRAAIALTMFFDAMHLAIFGLTAIFFWKWILLNFGVVHAFAQLRRERWSVPLWLGVTALGVMLLSTSFLQVARLGWFDSGGVNHAYWQVETRGGERVDVPSNFFLDTSVSFAQQRPGRPFDGFLPTHDWGTTVDAEVMRRFTRRCAPQAPLAPALAGEALQTAGDYVRRHHRRALQRAGGRGNIAYDWYPHHIWSSPFRYDDFRQLDLSTVTAYILVVQAKCVDVDASGQITTEELARDEVRFPL